jgi:hypothetical protein
MPVQSPGLQAWDTVLLQDLSPASIWAVLAKHPLLHASNDRCSVAFIHQRAAQRSAGQGSPKPASHLRARRVPEDEASTYGGAWRVREGRRSRRTAPSSSQWVENKALVCAPPSAFTCHNRELLLETLFLNMASTLVRCMRPSRCTWDTTLYNTPHWPNRAHHPCLTLCTLLPHLAKRVKT